MTGYKENLLKDCPGTMIALIVPGPLHCLGLTRRDWYLQVGLSLTENWTNQRNVILLLVMSGPGRDRKSCHISSNSQDGNQSILPKLSSLVKSFSGWNVGIISSSCSPKKPRLWRCASLSLISLSRFYLPRKVSTDQDKRQELCNWRGITTLWFRQRKVIQIMLMQFEEYLVCVCSWEGANWEDLICLLIWRQNIWQSQGKAGGGKR